MQEKSAGIQVHIVDDDPLVCCLLTEILASGGLKAEACESGAKFMRQFRVDGPTCVLLDVHMPIASGFDVHEWLVRRYPRVPVIFLTGSADVATVVRAMRNGAYDFVEKPVSASLLLDRVGEALSRSDADGSEAAAIRRLAAGRIADLTRRECEVLRCLIAGKRNKTIALELGISQRTVETHRANLMAKSGARTAAQLALLASRVET
jgi:FixJ family two-component response regulator